MTTSPRILGGAELINAEETLKRVGLTNGMNVADFGCGGRAYFALQAAKMIGSNGVVYAVDILKNNLQSVDELSKFYNLKNIRTIWANLEVLNSTRLESNSIDFVIITNLFFQTKKHRVVFDEASRILKPGGKVFIADWGKMPSPIGPPLEMRADEEDIKRKASESNFILIEEFDAGPYHFGLSLVKK